MIQRPHILSQIRRALSRSRVVSLIGPRQRGKTTLARQIVPSIRSTISILKTRETLRDWPSRSTRWQTCAVWW